MVFCASRVSARVRSLLCCSLVNQPFGSRGWSGFLKLEVLLSGLMHGKTHSIVRNATHGSGFFLPTSFFLENYTLLETFPSREGVERIAPLWPAGTASFEGQVVRIAPPAGANRSSGLSDSRGICAAGKTRESLLVGRWVWRWAAVVMGPRMGRRPKTTSPLAR